MFERISQMFTKEFIQVLRDPTTRVVIFISPVIQIVLFGYAATTDVRHIALAVIDRDNSTASRELVSRFVHSGYFDIKATVDRDDDARFVLDRSRAQALLRIDKGFDEDLRAGRTARVQIIMDGTDSNTAGIVGDYAGKITEEFSRTVVGIRSSRLKGQKHDPGRVEVERRAWFNENLESRNYYVPGVIAMVVTMISILLTSTAIVREKEIGTIEQIMVTPIRPVEFILGKTVPFALIGFADMAVVTLLSVYWFEVPMRGGLALLGLATALLLLATLGVGLLISTVSETQQQALMSTMFCYFPMALLSGFAYPIANMPAVVRWLTYANPLRYFLVIIRGLFLKGVGVETLWPQLVALGAMGVFILGLATSRFRKTLA